MDRDDLVERVAEAIFNESGTARLQSWESYRAFYQERGLLSPDYYALARAALAIIEPAVRAEITADLRRMSGGHVAHECALIHRVIERIEAAAIRAGAKP